MRRVVNCSSRLMDLPQGNCEHCAALGDFRHRPESEACMLDFMADAGHGFLLKIPPHPILLLERLIERVERIDLEHGIEPETDPKLTAARSAERAIEADECISAVHAMEKFQRIVEAERGSLLPVRKTAGLARDAEDIILRLAADDWE